MAYLDCSSFEMARWACTNNHSRRDSRPRPQLQDVHLLIGMSTLHFGSPVSGVGKFSIDEVTPV